MSYVKMRHQPARVKADIAANVPNYICVSDNGPQNRKRIPLEPERISSEPRERSRRNRILKRPISGI